MFYKAGTRLGAVYWTASKRQLAQRWLPPTPAITPRSNHVQQPLLGRIPQSRLMASRTQTENELSVLKQAIAQKNILQAQKSYEILVNRNGDKVDRDTLRQLFLLVRRGKRPADLAFLSNIVGTMESKLGIAPQPFEYHALMYAYGVHQQPDRAYQLLQEMRDRGLSPSIYSYNTLLGCYKRAGDEEGALRLLDEMFDHDIRPDVGTYNTLIHLFASKNKSKAYELYEQMQLQGVKPDAYTYSTLLTLATKDRNVKVGDEIYNQLLQGDRSELDITTVNSMLAYKVNAADDFNGALDLYHEIPSRFPDIKPDIVTYNLMLDACLKLNNAGLAHRIHADMKKAGCLPDVITYGTLMDAEARLGDINGAIKLFEKMTEGGIEPNDRILSCLAVLAAKETSTVEQVHRVNEIVKQYAESVRLNMIAYNNLLSGLARHGSSVQAQELYDRVFRNRVQDTDITTFTNLILAYVNNGLVDDAMDIYYELRNYQDSPNAAKHPIRLDTTFYTVLISALTRLSGEEAAPIAQGRPAPNYVYTVGDGPDRTAYLDGDSQPSLLTALALFDDMRRLLIRPDAHVYTAILHACAHYRDVHVLEQIHKLIRMDLYLDPDTAMYNALMNAYNRMGDGHTVMQMWDTLSLSSAPEAAIDQVTLSIVLDSCGHNGYQYKAKSIWRQAKRIGLQLNTNNYNSYIECLCRMKGRKGWDEAWRIMSEEMRRPGDRHSTLDSRPVINEKTVNTLISFARKKGFSEEELDKLEAWKNDILHS